MDVPMWLPMVQLHELLCHGSRRAYLTIHFNVNITERYIYFDSDTEGSVKKA